MICNEQITIFESSMQNAYIFGFSIFHSGIWESSLRATQNCFQNFWKRKIDKIRFKPYVYPRLKPHQPDWLLDPRHRMKQVKISNFEFWFSVQFTMNWRNMWKVKDRNDLPSLGQRAEPRNAIVKTICLPCYICGKESWFLINLNSPWNQFPFIC